MSDEEEDTCMSFEEVMHTCHMRRRMHGCHMRRRIHACHMRRRMHACHMRRRIHACQIIPVRAARALLPKSPGNNRSSWRGCLLRAIPTYPGTKRLHVIWGGGYMHVIWGGGYMHVIWGEDTCLVQSGGKDGKGVQEAIYEYKQMRPTKEAKETWYKAARTGGA
jgi:hypothetical protein